MEIGGNRNCLLSIFLESKSNIPVIGVVSDDFRTCSFLVNFGLLCAIFLQERFVRSAVQPVVVVQYSFRSFVVDGRGLPWTKVTKLAPSFDVVFHQ